MLNLDFTPMRAAQQLHMLDTCSLISYTITYDDYGAEVTSGTTQSGIQCGFSYARTFDVDTGAWLTTGTEANLRLPVDTDVTNITDVDITNRVTISGYWSVNGEPEFGNTCIVVHLKAYNE